MSTVSGSSNVEGAMDANRILFTQLQDYDIVVHVHRTVQYAQITYKGFNVISIIVIVGFVVAWP